MAKKQTMYTGPESLVIRWPDGSESVLPFSAPTKTAVKSRGNVQTGGNLNSTAHGPVPGVPTDQQTALASIGDLKGIKVSCNLTAVYHKPLPGAPTA